MVKPNNELSLKARKELVMKMVKQIPKYEAKDAQDKQSKKGA